MAKKKQNPGKDQSEHLAEMVRELGQGLATPEKALELLDLLRSEIVKQQQRTTQGLQITNTGSKPIMIDQGMGPEKLLSGKSQTIAADVPEPESKGPEDLEAQPPLPTYPARLLCFDIAPDHNCEAEFTLDVSTVAPEQQSGMTVVAKPLGRDRGAGFRQIRGKVSLALGVGQRLRVVGLGFDLNKAAYPILGGGQNE
jgi:hypothetical protein